MSQVRVRSWSCRMYRWLDERDLGWPIWLSVVVMAICMVLGILCVWAGIWQWSVIKDHDHGQLLRTLTAISNPFAFAIAGGFFLTALEPVVYYSLRRMLVSRLVQQLGREFARLMAAGEWPQYMVDETLVCLAGAYSYQMKYGQVNLAGKTLRVFWLVHNSAWAIGFYVRARIGDYLVD